MCLGEEREFFLPAFFFLFPSSTGVSRGKKKVLKKDRRAWMQQVGKQIPED